MNFINFCKPRFLFLTCLLSITFSCNSDDDSYDNLCDNDNALPYVTYSNLETSILEDGNKKIYTISADFTNNGDKNELGIAYYIVNIFDEKEIFPSEPFCGILEPGKTCTYVSSGLDNDEVVDYDFTVECAYFAPITID
mgnify:CR=1 FL=1